MNNTIDTTRLSLMLNDLRLPAIKEIWPKFAERSDKEGWPAARFLAAIAEHEIYERGRRRIERHLKEARLVPKDAGELQLRSRTHDLQGAGHGPVRWGCLVG